MFTSSSSKKKHWSAREPVLIPFDVSPMRLVPASIRKPPYADTGVSPPWNDTAQIAKKAEDKTAMRKAGALAASILDRAGALAKPGITTEEIDIFVHDTCIENNAYPSPLNYGKFPKSVCTSVNEVICHGIPDARELVDGDIVNIDVTVYTEDGFHGDCSRTFLVGESVSDAARKLVDDTEEALWRAIAVCQPGAPFHAIGAAIQDFADTQSYGVCPDFVGHGVGQQFHSGPAVVHYRTVRRGSSGTGFGLMGNAKGKAGIDYMVAGQTFTIEPMLTLGAVKGRFWDDDWTVTTTDSCLTAQFEHTLMVTDDGVEILTARPGGERLDVEGAATRMKELEASLARTSPSKSAAKSKKKKAKKATKGFGV